MRVRSLDMDNARAGELAEVHRLLAGAHAEANADEPYRPPADTEAFLRHPPASERRVYWVADGDARCIGFAELSAKPGSPTAKADVVVDHDVRRHGCGAVLLAAVRERARALGCRTLIGRHGSPAGAAFAAWAGAIDARRDVRSLLSLHEAELACLPVDGYALRSWTGAAPDELVATYAEARTAIEDAPGAAPGEWGAWNVERVRELEVAVARRGRDERVTVALDPTGTVVGFTAVRVSRSAGAIASTEDTAVLREHRGRGLARWLKVESLGRLQRDRPDVRLVSTTNAESNAAILGLNRALGFRPVALYTTCVLDV